ncbi:MAG: rhodanese-like domain-containing protein [Chitinophagales bacterium]|nr:rhodanese-like domain-containing protein [Chitinophagales bacterium]
MNKVWIYLLFFSVISACNNESVQESTVDEPVVEIVPNEVLSADEPINKVLTVVEFQEKLASTEQFQLIDIRTPEELAENGSIEGAINIDFYNPNFKAEIMNLNQDEALMLFCRSGGRSAQAAAMLKELGFKEVYDLQGGYTAWLESANK